MRTFSRICIPILLLFAAQALPTSDRQSGNSNTGLSPTREQLDQAINLAAGYLERACHRDGKFAYEVDIATGRESDSYNIVRHAGAIYALGMYNRSHPDPEAVDIMVRAAEYMRINYVSAGPQPGQLVVWSKPLEGNAQPKGQFAELGGTALGVVALAEVRLVRPDIVPLKDLQAMGRFLLSLQKEDGSFVQKYNLESGPIPKWAVLYYPGEAALAFGYLYEEDHSIQWLAAAGKALAYLAKTREGRSSVPADHWALIATDKMFPYCGGTVCSTSREVLVRHAVQVCNSILKEQLSGTELDGAFDPTGRTAPTATRMEGLLSALQFLPHDELSRRIQSATLRGLSFLLRAQIRSGPYRGGLPGAYVLQERGASGIRIDYLQHAIGAWIRYRQFVSTPMYNRV